MQIYSRFALCLLIISCKDRSIDQQKTSNPTVQQNATTHSILKCEGLLLNSTNDDQTLTNLLEALAQSLENGDEAKIRSLFLAYVNETIRQSASETLPSNIETAFSELPPDVIIELAKKTMNEQFSLSFANNDCVRRVERTLGQNANSILGEGYAIAMKEKVDEATKKLEVAQQSSPQQASTTDASNNPEPRGRSTSGEEKKGTGDDEDNEGVNIGPAELTKEQVKGVVTGVGAMLIVFSAYLGYEAVYGTKRTMQQHLDTRERASGAIVEKYHGFVTEFLTKKGLTKARAAEIQKFQNGMSDEYLSSKSHPTSEGEFTQKYKTERMKKLGFGAGAALAIGITAIVSAQIGLHLKAPNSEENEHIRKYIEYLKFQYQEAFLQEQSDP